MVEDSHIILKKGVKNKAEKAHETVENTVFVRMGRDVPFATMRWRRRRAVANRSNRAPWGQTLRETGWGQTLVSVDRRVGCDKAISDNVGF